MYYMTQFSVFKSYDSVLKICLLGSPSSDENFILKSTGTSKFIDKGLKPFSRCSAYLKLSKTFEFSRANHALISCRVFSSQFKRSLRFEKRSVHAPH